MTTYINVPVSKRDFVYPVQMPDVSASAMTVVNNSDVRIARNSDVRVTRNGDRRVAHNTTTAYPRLIRVEKRRLVVYAKVKNG